MTTIQAINIAEGYVEPQSEEQYLAAWQHLIDTGIVWTLQGWFGRTAMRMIDAGMVEKP